MPQNTTTAKPNPVGTKLVRLKDIDDATRQRAARALMREAKDAAEYHRLLELAYDPGNASGRIAA